MDVRTVVRNSKLYHACVKLDSYVQNSVVYEKLQDERTLAALLLLFVGLSAVRILSSNMVAAVKFLSFAVLFLALAWLVRPLQS